jgi:Cu(I)/Ag(I) efflux system protein CusF
MKTTATLSFILALFASAHLPAQAADMNMDGMNMGAPAKGAETEAVGVVDEINAAKGIVTISHQPIKSLGWPAMTMDFIVKDKKTLAKLSKGKKITFSFIEKHGDYLITKVK